MSHPRPERLAVLRIRRALLQGAGNRADQEAPHGSRHVVQLLDPKSQEGPVVESAALEAFDGENGRVEGAVVVAAVRGARGA